MQINHEKAIESARLKGSFLEFTKFFYEHLTSRPFIISQPYCRESHQITIAKAYTDLFWNQKDSHGLLINVPPGYGKSVMTCMWIAWCFAHYADCNFLYISYSHELAARHTSFIKQIMSSRPYRYLFDVEIRQDTRAKDKFETTAGGTVNAFGSQGAITGTNAGLPGLDRFSGAVVMDDAHKPDEIHSDSIRASVIRNYIETILQRPRDVNVPIVFIGQRLHEDDIAAYLMSGKDIRQWKQVILRGIDAAGNALYPEVQPLSYLSELQEKQPFVFASQIQQDPIPSGGSLFKPEWFVHLDKEPTFLTTFITADTAETNKSWNDATVFSFWGVYEIESMARKTGNLGLHWLDCVELRIEPKDLKENFMDFYANCSLHPKPPLMAAIEKKSTGVTLVSVLRELRGMQIREIERTRSSGSKTQRFLEVQPYIASKRISFTNHAKHAQMCIDHMSKITANSSHRHDDICFVRGTKIATTQGNINIEDITIKHKIITPFGIGNIKSCGFTGLHKVINNSGLEGTANHPIFYKDRFINLDTLTDVSDNSRFVLGELIKWKYLKLLCLTNKNINLWAREDITLALNEILKNGKVLKDFMRRFGNFIVEKRFLKGMWFTIKTIILLTTTLKTWSVFHVRNMLANIFKKDLKKILQRSWSLFNKLKKPQKNGMRAKKEGNGIQKMHTPAFSEALDEFVRSARRYTWEHQFQSIVHENATTLSMPNVLDKNEHLKEVFNLTVYPYGVYYANGILVSNCDTLSDAVRIALIEKTLYHLKDNNESTRKQLMTGMNETLGHRIRLGNVRYGRTGKNSY